VMQFIDLAAQYQKLKAEIDGNIQKVIAHGKFIMGPEVEELEEKLAAYVGVKHCLSCSNGTDALLMPLMAWGIGTGDAVFVPSFTFVATAEVAFLLGATPVFVESDPRTFNIDPLSLERAIISVKREGKLQPKVIIPVDLFGLPADYDALEDVAKKYGLKLLEDAAQGFGGVYKGRRAGSFGDAAATSFFPAKPLGCYGDGGAVFTNDDELMAVCKSIRVHGQGSDKYDNIRNGLNARLDTLQAAILLPKLQAFSDYEMEARNHFAAMYTDSLRDVLETPFIPRGLVSSWAQYSVLAASQTERSRIQAALKAQGIPTMVYYSRPLHLQTVYAHLGYIRGDLPVAEDLSSRVFSLPMHPYLEEQQVRDIIEAVRKAKASLY
jgi:UDP-2-acetamido-2-deoxy-ribo-hexuluronate aminotransferase